MILVGDLGFLCSLVLAVVGWFFIRRKWRRVVARREEIKRLMMLASEETDRAELEATAAYGSDGSVQAPLGVGVVEEPVLTPVTGTGSPPARQVQHHCEVCFSPTTTRCKQCKAVRYCSRKCQIIHWREGHKDECLSFVSHQNTRGGPQSHLKEFKQDEIQSRENVVGSDVMHATKPVESHSEEHLPSDPILRELNGMNDTKTQTSDDWKKTDINVKESFQSLPVDFSSSTSSVAVLVTSDCNLKDSNIDGGKSSNLNVESMKPFLLKQPTLTNPECGVAASGELNELKSGCIDIDEMSDSSTSSGRGATDSEEHLLSTPYTTPSSDFWFGSVKSIRSKMNALDESADVNILNSRSANLRSSGIINGNVETLASDTGRSIRDEFCTSTSILNKSRKLSELSEDDSCLHSSVRVNANVVKLYSDTKTVIRDDPRASTSVPTKSTESSELSEGDLKSREPLLLSSKLPGQDGVGNAVIGRGSLEEAKLSSASVHHKHVSEGHNVPGKQDGNLQSLMPHKELNHGVDGTNVMLDAVKENNSSRPKVSETHLSSCRCTKKCVSNAQYVQNESICMDASLASCSSCYLQSAKNGTNSSARRVVGQLRASGFIRNGSLGAESGTSGQHEGGSFSYEFFVKLYNLNKIELYPSGLINCGNSCYANAVLQCLAFTPPLTAYFLQGLHVRNCKNKEWCFTCELEALVKKAKEGNALLSPDRIMSQMQRIGHHLANGREEDAHEFLRCAIEAMQLACLKEAGVNVPSSLNEETTLLGLTFGGYLQSKIECLGCGGKSKQHERIMDLTVEIGGEIGNLEDALRQFTRSEILDGENKYHCGRCCSYQKAKKKLRVLEAPNVLTIALKRFQSGKYGKLNKAVKFPEILNLAKYMSETSDKSPIYQLYGVVVHLDVMNATFSGHYVCYVKNNQGRWYKADDSMVQKMELDKVLSQDAYMLFYSRCSPRAPRPIRSSMVHPKKSRDHHHHPSKSRSYPDEPWNVSNCHRSTRPNLEDDSDTSSFFSEVRSNSTDSSNGESTSTANDNFDQLLGERGNCWNGHCRSTSDSDTTSSSSSSSSSSSPPSTWSSLHPRHSPLADMDRYSSDNKSTTNVSSNTDSDGFCAGGSGNKMVVSAGTDGNKCKVSSSSSMKNHSNNPYNNNSRLGCRDNAKGVYI